MRRESVALIETARLASAAAEDSARLAAEAFHDFRCEWEAHGRTTEQLRATRAEAERLRLRNATLLDKIAKAVPSA